MPLPPGLIREIWWSQVEGEEMDAIWYVLICLAVIAAGALIPTLIALIVGLVVGDVRRLVYATAGISGGLTAFAVTAWMLVDTRGELWIGALIMFLLGLLWAGACGDRFQKS